MEPMKQNGIKYKYAETWLTNGSGPYLACCEFSMTCSISPQPSNVDNTNRVGNASVMSLKLCGNSIHCYLVARHSCLLIVKFILLSQYPNSFWKSIMPNTANTIQIITMVMSTLIILISEMMSASYNVFNHCTLYNRFIGLKYPKYSNTLSISTSLSTLISIKYPIMYNISNHFQ